MLQILAMSLLLVLSGLVWSGLVWSGVCCRQRELAALQSALTEVGRHVKEETSVLASGQQELEVAQAALRERVRLTACPAHSSMPRPQQHKEDCM